VSLPEKKQNKTKLSSELGLSSFFAIQTLKIHREQRHVHALFSWVATFSPFLFRIFYFFLTFWVGWWVYTQIHAPALLPNHQSNACDLLQFKFRSQFNRSAIQAEIQIFAFFQSTKAALRDVRWGTLEENGAAQELNLLEIISIY